MPKITPTGNPGPVQQRERASALFLSVPEVSQKMSGAFLKMIAIAPGYLSSWYSLVFISVYLKDKDI